MAVLQIQITTPLTPEACETLEDGLKDFLEKQGLNGTIFNNVTYNTTRFGAVYAKQLKKPDDVIEVHQTLENIFGE